MSVTIRIPTPIRRVTNGADKVSAEGETLRDIIASMEAQYPGREGSASAMTKARSAASSTCTSTART